jgi:hypothetical protein
VIGESGVRWKLEAAVFEDSAVTARLKGLTGF